MIQTLEASCMFRLTAPPTPTPKRTPIERVKEPIDRLFHKRERERERRAQRAKRGALIAAGSVSVGVIVIVLSNRRRRHALVGRTVGLVRHRSHDYDDVTLARKVESVIFRPADAPKGDVDVNAHDGIVELRGVVADSARIDALVSAAEHVDGVARVENLLHLPGTPARHAPPARTSLNGS
ncbi:BON domain-containing protein [Conexibacter stalactiti]|uniref:BON domain-containing protein n=1 Tax=Conexibacter stalactiti TaxID=1940611 RepID=A0ABU4HVK8_9ACTN|nr:BON domain-containing protein [Conexibacter stalactiti]MDW5597323.1 BON domain-containing protein [Conexibacter stalactiti]MEC5037965.1 BON domain-containing protein [Conexibacter stalactiti]